MIWEYQIVDISAGMTIASTPAQVIANAQPILAAQGNLGWELVAIYNTLAFLKRPVHV